MKIPPEIDESSHFKDKKHPSGVSRKLRLTLVTNQHP